MICKTLSRVLRKGERVVLKLPLPKRREARVVEKSFARIFATDDGRIVLGHLNGLTFMRTAGADVPESTLRYLEGQRALLATIVRLIERGRTA